LAWRASGSVQHPKLAPQSMAIPFGRSSSRPQINWIVSSSGEAPVFFSQSYCPLSVSGMNIVP
jgi:hypothetical protein